jgi:aminoglycoside 6'-N-acetyltransferase
MDTADLGLVEAWLRDPEVARWYVAGSSIEDELDELRQCVAGDEQTEALIVTGPGGSIGWCQWYLCDDYPDHAAGVGASPGDAGIDYAIGDPASRGRGVGTALITALVAYIRQRHPDAGVVADPEASNVASRRVLEKNGFQLLAERPVASEPTSTPMAIYRLPPQPAVRRAEGEDAGTHSPATTQLER